MSTANAPMVLEARGLVKCYGHVTALDGVDFEVRAGEIMAVIGDNGAGKSSLIKALSGAMIPDGGEIWLDGARVQFSAVCGTTYLIRVGGENPQQGGSGRITLM
jgi:fructose transport system ATP-binding protein